MKLVTGLAAVLVLLAVACGGDDDDADTSTVVIPAADADRVAHEALITVEDLPGDGWQVVEEDVFGDDSDGDDFLAMLEGTPECETLENLSTLGSLFGDAEEEEAEPVGRAQRAIERQDADAFIPTSVEVEVEVEETAAGSRAQFQLVKELLESDETANCLIVVLNRQFAETGPSGFEVDVRRGSATANVPNDGARMAFDVGIALGGIEVDMAMQMYFWPYGNANVEVMLMGTNESLTDELVQGVLTTVDERLQTAAAD